MSNPSPPSSPRVWGSARRRSSVEVKYGYPRRRQSDNSDADRQFPVPLTRTVWQTLSNWSGLSTWVIWGILALECAWSLSGKLSRAGHVLHFLFWRFGYNVGLGLALRWQSNHFWVSGLWKKYVLGTKENSFVRKIAFSLVSDQVSGGGIAAKDLYPDLCAWLCFRFVVDIILCSDVIAYILLVVKCAYPPTSIGFWEILQFTTGLAMTAFNFWAKLDAHRCIGDYAWYWGDFFFRVEQHLTFDGIFELFPHPMYTVGYAFFYGFAIMSRSYTVLFVSLFAHVLQLLFLVVVENPHIDKTYGTASNGQKLDPEVFRILYLTPGGKEARQSSVLLWNLDFLSIADIATLATSLYAFTLCWYLKEPWNLIHCLLCRLVHWMIVGTILVNQSEYNWWVRLFELRGHSTQHAFVTWKQLYNYTSTVNMFVFIGTALQFVQGGPLTPRDLACIFVGFVLICINGWAYKSMYSSLGDFGWYYGDFFTPPNLSKPNVSYSGVYRFLNNPDCVIGYAGLHGVALCVRSWSIFALALAFQAMSVLFVNLVEVPHMDRLYENRQIRKEAPLEVALKEKLPQALKEQAKRIREQATQEIFHIYSRLAPTGEDNCVLYDSPQRAFSGETISVKFRTSTFHSSKDWIGIYDINSPSAPGFSKGCWQYVPQGADSGTLTFTSDKTPMYSGVFEFRYHVDGSYNIATVSTAFLLQDDPNAVHGDKVTPQNEEEKKE
jgi:phosphatidylethanolamine N-methyltransferase